MERALSLIYDTFSLPQPPLPATGIFLPPPPQSQSPQKSSRLSSDSSTRSKISPHYTPYSWWTTSSDPLKSARQIVFTRTQANPGIALSLLYALNEVNYQSWKPGKWFYTRRYARILASRSGIDRTSIGRGSICASPTSRVRPSLDVELNRLTSCRGVIDDRWVFLQDPRQDRENHVAIGMPRTVRVTHSGGKFTMWPTGVESAIARHTLNILSDRFPSV